MTRNGSAFTSVALVSLLVLAAVLPEAERPPRDQVVFAFTDDQIDESSGLVALGPGTGGLVATVNDSGDEARVFIVDPGTGDTVGVTRWDAEVVDVEALAPVTGPGRSALDEVWVADIGDNWRRRDDLMVHRLPVGRGDRELSQDDVPAYPLAYPDGAQDAETLLAHPRTGRLYVATKGILSGRLHAAPRRLDPAVVNRLEPVGPRLPGMLTDGAFTPDGRHLVLRGYHDAYVYDFPGLERVGRFPLPSQRQGEGLAVTADGTLLLSGEGGGSEVLALRLPPEIAARVAGDGGAPLAGMVGLVAGRAGAGQE